MQDLRNIVSVNFCGQKKTYLTLKPNQETNQNKYILRETGETTNDKTYGSRTEQKCHLLKNMKAVTHLKKTGQRKKGEGVNVIVQIFPFS